MAFPKEVQAKIDSIADFGEKGLPGVPKSKVMELGADAARLVRQVMHANTPAKVKKLEQALDAFIEKYGVPQPGTK